MLLKLSQIKPKKTLTMFFCSLSICIYIYIYLYLCMYIHMSFSRYFCYEIHLKNSQTGIFRNFPGPSDSFLWWNQMAGIQHFYTTRFSSTAIYPRPLRSDQRLNQGSDQSRWDQTDQIRGHTKADQSRADQIRSSQIFPDFPALSQIFPELSQSFPGFSRRSSWSLSQSLSRSFPGFSRIFPDFPRFSRIFPDFPGFPRIRPELSRSFPVAFA